MLGVHALRNVEVDQLDLLRILVIDNIIRVYVAVADSVLVHVLQRIKHLLDDYASLCLPQLLLPLNHLLESRSQRVLYHQVRAFHLVVNLQVLEAHNILVPKRLDYHALFDDLQEFQSKTKTKQFTKKQHWA